MTTLLPEPVQPLPGAEVVDFRWGTAEALAAALDSVIDAFNSHFDVDLPDLRDGLVDWRGSFRDDYDSTVDTLTTDVSQLVTDCQTAADNVVSAAENANSDQQVANGQAEDDAAAIRRAEERLV